MYSLNHERNYELFSILIKFCKKLFPLIQIWFKYYSVRITVTILRSKHNSWCASKSTKASFEPAPFSTSSGIIRKVLTLSFRLAQLLTLKNVFCISTEWTRPHVVSVGNSIPVKAVDYSKILKYNTEYEFLISYA